MLLFVVGVCRCVDVRCLLLSSHVLLLLLVVVGCGCRMRFCGCELFVGVVWLSLLLLLFVVLLFVVDWCCVWCCCCMFCCLVVGIGVCFGSADDVDLRVCSMLRYCTVVCYILSASTSLNPD